MKESDRFLARLFQAFNCQHKHINTEELTKLMFLKAETRDYCRTDFQNWDGWTRKQNGADWRVEDCYLPERLRGQPVFSALYEMAVTPEDYDYSLACGPIELRTAGSIEGIWGN